MGKRRQPLVNHALVARALGGGHTDPDVHLLNEVGNWGYVCEQHKSKPGGFAGQPAASFVGRAVKLCFPKADGATENMWVRVERLGKADEGGELIGILHNEPIDQLAPEFSHLHHGDWVAFDVAEIAAVDAPES